MSNVFPIDKIKDQLKKNVDYMIGVDELDLNHHCYSLVMRVDGNSHFILSKDMKDGVEFKKEVENLSKYFNATIIVQK